jgi:hypothetical protein
LLLVERSGPMDELEWGGEDEDAAGAVATAAAATAAFSDEKISGMFVMMTSGRPWGFVSHGNVVVVVVNSSFVPVLILLGSIVNDVRDVAPSGGGRILCGGDKGCEKDAAIDVGIVAPSLVVQLGLDGDASTG